MLCRMSKYKSLRGRSPLFRLAETVFVNRDGPTFVEYFDQAMRDGRSFREIDRHLNSEHGLTISHETLRRWAAALAEEGKIGINKDKEQIAA